MKNNSNRHTVWMDSEMWDMVEKHYLRDNCTRKNEYIEKAIQFYSGCLDAEGADEYLPRVLAEVLEGKLSALGGRIGRLLFKPGVEQDMNANILAALAEVNLDAVDHLLGQCVQRRKGELVALLWDDLDIRNRTIFVNKQYIKNPSGKLTLCLKRSIELLNRIAFRFCAKHDVGRFPRPTSDPVFLHDLLYGDHRPFAHDGTVVHVLVQHHIDQMLRRALYGQGLLADDHMVHAVNHLRTYIQNRHILCARHSVGDFAKAGSNLFGEVTGLYLGQFPTSCFYVQHSVLLSAFRLRTNFSKTGGEPKPAPRLLMRLLSVSQPFSLYVKVIT